jgi:phosphatidylglycerophosphatase C
MQRIAIYDLDKTILATPTFTAFLFFSARHLQHATWWRIPIWAAALIGYVLKLYGRRSLKQFGMRLFIGRIFSAEVADDLAKNFANSVIPANIMPGAARAISADRAAKCRLVIASAAQEIYTAEIGRRLQFDSVIATRNRQDAQGNYSHIFEGENNYGPEKLRRILEWMASQGLERTQCHIRFYSDHHSDADVLNWADEGILITRNGAASEIAKTKQWSVQDWR